MLNVLLDEYPERISLYIDNPSQKEIEDINLTLLNFIKEAVNNGESITFVITIKNLPNMFILMYVVNELLSHRSLLDVGIKHTYIYCPNNSCKDVLNNITCINDVNNHTYGSKIKCAMCRHSYNLSETVVIKGNIDVNNTGPTLGTKIEHLINTIKTIITEDNTKKIIVFSQWDNMLRLVSKIFNEHEIKNIFLNGSINTISSKIRKFKIQNDINVVLMSSDKSPSGLHLTEASTIILLDTLNTTKEEAQIIEEQAIGRAVRIGQTKQVEVKRFIMRNTIEHDYYIRNIEE